MESFKYVDIFATKGLEYLLVLGFLMALILYWKHLNKQPVPAEKAVLARYAWPENAWFQVVDGAYYHQGHTWAAPGSESLVKVGIDDFAQKLLGKPGSVDLPPVGARVEQGETGWKLCVDSHSIDILSPVSGEVISINEEVIRSPELINEDPYGRGWLMQVHVPKLTSNLRNLLSGRLAVDWMEETVDRLRNKMSVDLGVVLQDGGVPVSGMAKSLSSDRWHEVVREFLLNA